MATAVRRSALERPASHSRRDAVVREFLPLADALARRFQRRFPDLIELDDAHQVARYELIRAVACVKPGCCTTAAYLKRRIQGALQHYLRVDGRLVRVSRREHQKGMHPLGHESLDAHGPDERPYLDHLASPESEAPVFEGSEGAAEALLERISANEAAILRLRVLEGQSLRRVSREVGISAMTVSRHEQAALAALREQLAWAPAGAGQPAPNSAPLPWVLAALTAPGNPEGSCVLAMPLTAADIGIQLLMDSTVSLQGIKARITARVFAAVHQPERGPAVRAVLEQLLAVLDATRADGVI